jgi:hypothetical protein
MVEASPDLMRRPRLPLTVLLWVGLLLVLTSCTSSSVPGSASGTTAGTPATAGAVTASTPAVAGTPTVTVTPSAPASSSAAGGLTAADRLAGLTSLKITDRGSGRLRTVPGTQKAPGKGRVYEVRVQVEAGLPIDGPVFAKFVLATLNDRRSWTENGKRTFARTDGTGDFTVVLATPDTSAALCRPLQTFGKLSCHEGSNAVLTMYRWVKGIAGYDGDTTGYRHYVVNHEVGHALGHHHEYCAGPGKLAPLMMQQTKGLKGCRPNPWPHPDA